MTGPRHTGPRPAVSVVMAAYNGAALIGETIRSLLAQRFADWELLVADDCSRDATRAIVAGQADPRIRLIALDVNGGPVVARNHAFAHARGRYIAALDQDDLCHPDRFARQVAWLDAHPETVLVSSAVALLQQGTERAPPFARDLTPAQIDWQLHIRNPLVWSSVMFRADVARGLDPFERPDYRYAEDFDLYHRLRPFGSFAQLGEELLTYRVHGGGASKQFVATMEASAGRVLAEAHLRLFGAPTPETALLVRHVMLREPVPDVATLLRIFEFLGTLRDQLVVARSYGPAAQREIDEQITHLWWAVCRAGIRAGSLPMHKALSSRPHPTPDIGRRADLFLSRLVGSVRAMRG
jgi:hypothetical protein